MTEQDRRNIETVRLMYTGDETERANIAQDIVCTYPDTIRYQGIITASRNTPN